MVKASLGTTALIVVALASLTACSGHPSSSPSPSVSVSVSPSASASPSPSTSPKPLPTGQVPVPNPDAEGPTINGFEPLAIWQLCRDELQEQYPNVTGYRDY